MSNDDRRADLLERRRLLGLRRQRAAISARFRETARPLCAAGVRFAKSMPAANLRSLGRLSQGPGQDEELDFGWMGNSSIHYWEHATEEAGLVRAALAACADPEERVTVIWHPAEAGLRIAAGDLARHAESILAPGLETIWIVAAEPGDWIIQAGRWSRAVAYSPAVPENSAASIQVVP